MEERTKSKEQREKWMKEEKERCNYTLLVREKNIEIIVKKKRKTCGYYKTVKKETKKKIIKLIKKKKYKLKDCIIVERVAYFPPENSLSFKF